MEEYIDVSNFDLTDEATLAALEEYVPDINMDAAPEAPQAPAPPPDGVYQIKVRPNRKRPDGPVYYKDLKKDPRSGKIVDGKVIAALVARTFDPNANKEGVFLKDYYASSVAFGPDRGSSITFICKQAGSKIDDRAPIAKIKDTIEEVLALNEEDGVALWARLRWIKSAPRVVEIAEGVYTYEFDERGNKIYNEVKGEAKIKALAVEEAKREVLVWFEYDDESVEDFEERKRNWVDTAPSRAHLFWDPVAEKELRVNAEIAELLDPEKLPLRR
jgi:hypothetical protein